MVYLIAYDLNRPGQEYSKLYEAIESLGDWCHCMESVWLVDTCVTTESIGKKLRSATCLDDNDKLLIAEICKGMDLQLSPDVQRWIANHISSNQYPSYGR